MAKNESTGIPNSNVKWIVIGIVVLVILFLFKKEIGSLIDRTESVSVTADGLILKTQTVTTVLGEIIVSGPPTVDTAGITATTKPNFAIEGGFKINWKPELWSNNKKLAQLNDAELFLLYSVPDGYQPSIAIKSYGGFSNAKAFLDSVTYPDRQVSKVEFGPAGETGIRTSEGESNGITFNYIERVLFNAETGLVYVATAERPTAEVGNTELWESTRKVLNSFRPS